MLELMGKRTDGESKWNNIKDLSLLSLQSLKASNIPINCLANLILSSGRFPISLKFKKERDYYYESGYDDLVDLIEIYKEKGVIKNFVHYHYDEDSDLLEIYKTKRVINNPESVIKNSEIKSTSIWNRFKKKFNKYPW
ncbi:unnamed protein product [Rhizophagus irregularis]|nr:unnamed protein product [Rhizophagus irregularis]